MAPFLAGVRRNHLRPGRGIDMPLMIIAYPAGKASEVIPPYFNYWGIVLRNFFDAKYYPTWEEYRKMK